MAARFEIYRTQDGGVEQLRLRPGENRVRVLPGRQFRLQDSNLDAEQLRVLQVDSDLVIENVPLDGDAGTASVILEGYYRICSASDQCAVTAGGDETVSIPDAAEGAGGAVLLADVNTKPLGALNDGTFVLYDPKFEAPILPVLGDVPTKPLLYGLGGAAVLGLAAAGGGGGGGGDGQAPQGNISLTLKSATYFNTRFPVLNGTAEPGSEVQVRIDTDGDQHANVTYTTKADENGNWAVDLKTATPSSGTLPAAGLSDTNSLEVVGSNKGVQSTLPLTTLHFDDTPPASAEVASVAGDNIITAPEKAAGVAISGTAEANGSVELKLGTLTRLVAVDANGNWSTTLQADDLPTADGSYTLSATAIDAAGNRAPEVTSKVIMNTTGTAAIIGTISEDGYVNAKEAAAPVKVMGTAAPNSKVALWLTDEKNPLAEVQADANGKWEAGVPLPAGLADGKHVLSVTTTNAQGNTATSKAEFTLDKTPPAPAANLKLEGNDTTITSLEAKNGVSLSGTGEAGTKVTVSIGGGKTQTATVGANGGWKVEFKEGDLPMPGQGNSTSTAFNVVLQDKAGNDSAVATQNVTLQGPLSPLPTPRISQIAGDDIINAAEAQGAVSVSGIAEAGSKVSVKLGNLPAKEVTADANGAWTAQLTDLSKVPDGSYDVTATASMDGRAPSAAGVHKITLDKTAPGQPTNIKTNGGDTTISADEAKTGKITFTGDTPTGAQNADTVTVTWNGVSKPGTVTNGKWSVDFDSVPPVPAGQASVPANVTVQAHDKAGNNSTTATQAITVQNSALPSLAPTFDPVAQDNIVNKAEAGSVNISGTAAPNATLQVVIGTRPPQSVTADGQGKWIIEGLNMNGMPDGKYIMSATATAPGGTTSAPANHEFTVDKTPPKPHFSTFGRTQIITAEAAKNDVTFRGSSAEADTTLSATWNGKPVPISHTVGSLWKVTVPAADIPAAPANGTAKATLVVTVTDKAGNATEISQDVTIQGAPAVTRQTTVNGKVANDDVINAVEANGVEVSGTAEPNSNIRVQVPGTKVATSVRSGADGLWKASLNFTGLQDGQHTIEATASQPGSTSTSVGTHTVTLAQKLPSKPANLQFDGHAGKVITGAEATDGVTVTGDAAPGSTVQVKLGATTLPANVDAAGHFSATLPAPAVTPGGTQPYVVTVTVADAAGNTPQSWAEVIQVQGPALKPATPVPAAVTTAAVTPATPDADADAAGGAAAQPATPTAPAAAPAADAAAQPATPPAAQPSALGITAGDTLGKSLATAKALPGNQGSRLSLNELLDQSETLSLPGEASSTGSNAATSAAGSAAGTGTPPAAPAGTDVATAVDSGATALSSTATVNTLLGTQQPWETTHPAL